MQHTQTKKHIPSTPHTMFENKLTSILRAPTPQATRPSQQPQLNHLIVFLFRSAPLRATLRIPPPCLRRIPRAPRPSHTAGAAQASAWPRIQRGWRRRGWWLCTPAHRGSCGLRRGMRHGERLNYIDLTFGLLLIPQGSVRSFFPAILVHFGAVLLKVASCLRHLFCADFSVCSMIALIGL